MNHPTYPAITLAPEIVDAIKLAGSNAWDIFFSHLHSLECLKLPSTEDIDLPKLKARVEGMRHLRQIFIDVCVHSKNQTTQQPNK